MKNYLTSSSRRIFMKTCWRRIASNIRGRRLHDVIKIVLKNFCLFSESVSLSSAISNSFQVSCQRGKGTAEPQDNCFLSWKLKNPRSQNVHQINFRQSFTTPRCFDLWRSTKPETLCVSYLLSIPIYFISLTSQRIVLLRF